MTWEQWVAVTSLAAGLLSLTASIIAIWMARKSDRLLRRAENVLTGEALLDRRRRLREMGMALQRWLHYEDRVRGGDSERVLLVTDFIAAADACDADMDLPLTQRFVSELEKRGGGKPSAATLTGSALDQVDDVQAEILDNLAVLWGAVRETRSGPSARQSRASERQK